MKKRQSQRGLTLVECAASLALASIAVAGTTQVSQSAAVLVSRVRVESETLDVARNVLEHELGAPCGAAFACADGYRCSVTRAAVTAVADRVVAHAERSDAAASENLRTLAPAAACGG